MGVLATQATTPIIGQIAWVLGKLMNGIFNVLNGAFGIQNIGLCIIIFTIDLERNIDNDYHNCNGGVEHNYVNLECDFNNNHKYCNSDLEFHYDRME